MAKRVLKDAVVTVAGQNLSNYFSEVAVETSADDVDITGFTTSGFREKTTGFRDASITGTVFQSFAEVDAVLWPLGPGNTAGTTFPVTVKSSSGATSSDNPLYTMGAALLYDYSPLAGGVGDALSTDVTFQNAGTAGITRSTA